MTAYDESVIRQEIAVIGALWRGLDEFLGGLSAEDWGRQSACEAWTVRDVAGHLTNRAERQIASMTRGRAGDCAAPAGFTPAVSNMAMSAANADADIAYAQGLGDGLLPEFRRLYADLSALLDGFSGDEWGMPCWHPRRGTMTAREYVSQRIQELAIHDWDIRSAFDADAELHPEAIPVLLGMSQRWLEAAYQPGEEPPDGVHRIWFRMYDAESIHVEATPERATVTSGPHAYTEEANFDFLVDTFANTYLLLAYGRLDVTDRALYGRRLWLAGLHPMAQMERFVGWMRGF